MKKKYSFSTTMYESSLPKMYIFLVFIPLLLFNMKYSYQKFREKIFYQQCLHLGKNDSLHCSQITVVHVYVNVFLLNSPSVSLMQTE